MSCTALCFVFLNANINVVVQYRIHSLNFIFVWFCDSTIFLMIFKEGDQTFELLTKLNNSIISLHVNVFYTKLSKKLEWLYIYKLDKFTTMLMSITTVTYGSGGE